MLKLTRLDHHVIAINPDHIAWVEATPDTTLCLLGDRKIIVRESVDEVVHRFIEARAAVGCTSIGIPAMPSPSSLSSNHRRSSHGPSSSGLGRMMSSIPSAPAPRVVDDDGANEEEGGA